MTLYAGLQGSTVVFIIYWKATILSGLLRRSMQILVILFVGVYQLWYAQGYQEFAGIESSVTTKVKLIVFPFRHSLLLKCKFSTEILCPFFTLQGNLLGFFLVSWRLFINPIIVMLINLLELSYSLVHKRCPVVSSLIQSQHTLYRTQFVIPLYIALLGQYTVWKKMV